jgi:hypothetical protein
MSELLLQTIVERLEAQGLLLQTMATDADKAQVEIRAKFASISSEIASLQYSRTDPAELEKLMLAVKKLQATTPQSLPESVKKYLWLPSTTWFAIGMFVLFIAMSWCWGYTFRGWSTAEIDGVKFRYLQSIPNNSLSRFCRQADSLHATGSLDSLLFLFAGEKEKKHRNSVP